MVIESAALLAAAQSLAVYAALAATPGPNAFAVGAQAALCGLRATLPLCLGIGLGVALAAGGACAGAARLQGAGAEHAARTLAAAALILMAMRLAEAPRAVAAGRARAASFGVCGLGLATALTNPVTWAYFATACTGPAGRAAELLVAGAFVVALLVAVLLALVLGRPGPRAWAERHQPAIRLGAAALLGGYAGWAAVPMLFG